MWDPHFSLVYYKVTIVHLFLKLIKYQKGSCPLIYHGNQSINQSINPTYLVSLSCIYFMLLKSLMYIVSNPFSTIINTNNIIYKSKM